jgi:hypothetical protein
MSLISSDALEFELQRIIKVEGREQIFAFLGVAKIFVETTDNIEGRAESLCKLGFTLYDALHLAFAEDSDATVFLTTDDRLLRKAISYADNIKVRVSNPVTWLLTSSPDLSGIIPRLTAIHRPINRVSSGRRKIAKSKLEDYYMQSKTRDRF